MVLNLHCDPAQRWRPQPNKPSMLQPPSPQKRTRPEVKEREQNLLLQHGGALLPWGRQAGRDRQEAELTREGDEGLTPHAAAQQAELDGPAVLLLEPSKQ